jgi:hypothetical protein
MTLFTFITLILLQFNTSTFTFKNTYNISGSDLKEISYFLEKEHDRLKSKWNIDTYNKIEVFFCSSTDDFIWKTGTNKRISALYKNNVIFLQPLNFLKGRRILFGVLRHELIHAMLDRPDKGKIPKWFNEAFSIYISNELKRVKKKSEIKFKTMAELESKINSKDYKVTETSYYYLGLTMQFLIQQYGEEKIKSLLAFEKNENFEAHFKSVMGESFESIEKKITSQLSKF